MAIINTGAVERTIIGKHDANFVHPLGDELVVNGGFDTDSDWVKNTGWSISGGAASASSSFDSLAQAGFNFIIEKNYKVTYEVKNYVNGNIRFQFTGGATLSGINRDSNGIYTQYVKATANHSNFRFKGTNFTGSIDNISLKEVLVNRESTVTNTGAVEREIEGKHDANFVHPLGDELAPSIATIVNAGGGSITQISQNSYISTSDGTSPSIVRPKFDFATTSGKTYKLVITPIGTITGTVNFDFYDGSTYLFQDYDFTTTKEITFTDNGTVFGAFDGTQTYSVSNFTVSIKEVLVNRESTVTNTGVVERSVSGINESDTF